MKIYLVFSGEGRTDERFFTNLVGRLIEEFLFERNQTAEISWITVPKKGSSKESILRSCALAKDHHAVIIHRDSDTQSLNDAFQSHFAEAFQTIRTKEDYNANLIALIPVRETESWMLIDKDLLKEKIGTNLSNTVLGLSYKISRIESLAQPKELILNVINRYRNTLAPKRRRYAPALSDLYDELGMEVSLVELANLESFRSFRKNFYAVFDSLLEEHTLASND